MYFPSLSLSLFTLEKHYICLQTILFPFTHDAFQSTSVISDQRQGSKDGISAVHDIINMENKLLRKLRFEITMKYH